MTSGHRGLQPRKQPRQARAELTRQRILTAAAHVFADHGYAAGTTNRIAERARISIGSLYQYYPNKDAILVELMARHLDTGMAAMERRQNEEPPDSIVEIIRAYVRTATENHLDDPQLLRVMLEQAPRSPELLAKISHNVQSRVTYLGELLARHPEVHVGDTHTAARLIVSTVELVTHQLIAAPDPIGIPRFENELVAMLTRYLTAGPDDAMRPGEPNRADPADPADHEHR
ncbi:TetR/AcrR family transcriptional regulator [Streptomyces celluloflavus]|uniref:TetR/AcrR family transcriptional regulator n=1 Tax=Streptomyces celluloflavus TaxID=58344 RepID=UPI003461264D|nr:TetR/AcrR family transcriptional regulator [Streptomyces celluloflavus]